MTPLELPIEAIVSMLLLQLPPLTSLVRVVVSPVQIVVTPLMAGVATTVTSLAEKQPPWL